MTFTSPQRRRLTDAEMARITQAIVAAATPFEALAAAFGALYDALLAPLGESTADYGPHRRLKVTEFAIGADQNTYICRALAATAPDDMLRLALLLQWADLRPGDLPPTTGRPPVRDSTP